ncbi:MAG: DUF1439 domain-containing protein [Burkholderiaceae bacterium]
MTKTPGLLNRRQLWLLPLALLGTAHTRAQVPPPPDSAPAGTPDRPGLPVPLAVLEALVAQRFPLRYPVPGLLNLDLQPPSLSVIPAQNRMLADMSVQAAGPALHRAHRGQLEVDFGLRYVAADRTVRAHSLRFRRLRFPTLPASTEQLLSTYGTPLAEQTLQELVLHRLEPRELALAEALGLEPSTITVTDTGVLVGLVPRRL